MLFLQTLYPWLFYPATISQAWFWFSVIPLLMIAVYLASFGKWRVAAALTATPFVYLIRFDVSSGAQKPPR